MSKTKRWWLLFPGLVLVFLFGLWLDFHHHAGTDRDRNADSLQLLKRLVAGRTILPYRLSGELGYYPPEKGTERHVASPSSIDNDGLRRVDQTIRHHAQTEPTLENLKAQASFLLLSRFDTTATRSAIESLIRAKHLAPEDPAISNDLAAAYSLLAEQSGDPSLRHAALELVENSLESDPLFPEARYNRALILEGLHLNEQALSAWKAYLDRGDPDPWSLEAKRRRETLEAITPADGWPRRLREASDLALKDDRKRLKALLEPFGPMAKRHFEAQVLDWSRAVSDGDPVRMRNAARVAVTFAQALEADPFYSDTAALLSPEVSAETSGIRALQKGLRLYRLGLAESTIERRRRYFQDSRVLLEEAGSPFALKASYELGICSYRELDFSGATFRFGELAARAESESYGTLQVEALWVKGLSQMGLGRLGDAIDSYRAALAVVQRLDDADLQAGILCRLGEALAQLGESAETWEYLYRALSLAPKIGNPKRFYHIYGAAAYAAWQEGSLAAALAFQDQAVAEAQKSEDPWSICDTLLWRARILSAQGRFSEAAEDLTNADFHKRKIVDEPLVNWIESERLIVQAELMETGHAEETIENLKNALGFYEAKHLPIHMASTHFARARIYRSLGNLPSAVRDLARSIDRYEETRSQLREDRYRALFLERVITAYDQMVSLLLETGDHEAAFDYFERKRARVLFDQMSQIGLDMAYPEPRSFAELSEKIPEQTALIVYALVSGELYACIAGKEVTWARLDPKAIDLVPGYLAALQGLSTGSELTEQARALYRFLIRPLAPYIGEESHWVMITDGNLHLLPFAALINPETGRYLIEEHTLTIAPSANTFVACLLRDRQISRSGNPSAMIIGNPSFDRDRFPRLPNLGAAANEAERIARCYRKPNLLVGKEATKRSFLEAAGSAEVVHFAGHAVANLDMPLNSMLIFASEPDDSDHGILYAKECYGRQFVNTRLIVLSACETAGGKRIGAEGVASLARPFLAANVPGVIASLWNVEDAGTAILMERLHRLIAEGRSPMEALRRAQTGLIHHNIASYRSPVNWAAFQFIGFGSPLFRKN